MAQKLRRAPDVPQKEVVRNSNTAEAVALRVQRGGKSCGYNRGRRKGAGK